MNETAPERSTPEPMTVRSSRRNRRFLAAQLTAFLVGLFLTVPTEWMKLKVAAGTNVGLLAWFLALNHDTTFPFVLLLMAPGLWFVRRRLPTSGVTSAGRRSDSRRSMTGDVGSTGKERTATPSRRPIDGRAWAMALACSLTSIAASVWIASFDVPLEEKQPPVKFGKLPPDYHDEYSYLFQAKTFLAGRLSYSSSPRMPELFDQMHVLNEGRGQFASRYFPGVGLWLAPFVAVGHPEWGEWLGAALAAFFVFWAGRELARSEDGNRSGNGVGLTAGLLTALSPGMALFSNLLLSHEPTMAGLGFFLFTFLRLMRTSRARDAFGAGCGLSFAMLCRPMTAAGFALPFGLWLAWRLAAALIRGRRTPATDPAGTTLIADSPLPSIRWQAAAVMGAPLAVGLALLFVYDFAITGNGFLSPYQLYTDLYTPRHVYGFNNVVRGEKQLGPKVLANYDRWAENLTPRLAAENVAKRVAATAKWTLGPVPLAMGTVVFLLAVLWDIDSRWRWLAASVVSLHAVHIPYWFSGIMDWHYVFETGPLLLLILAVTSRELVNWWKQSGRTAMLLWWGALVASAVVTNWLPFDPFWLSRVDYGVQELAFARVKYEKFDRMVEQLVTQRPALLLIESDPADRHIDYVINDPDLKSPVLRGRYRPGKTDLAQVRAAFPDRTLYLYQVRSGQLVRLSP